MKNSITSYVGWLLLVSAFGFYIYGISEAVILSWTNSEIGPGRFSDILSTTLSSIQALLLTNLGVVLGISIAKPDSPLARNIMLNSFTNPTTKAPPPPVELREKLQVIAVAVYVFCLIVCLITWIHNDFSTETKQVVSIVPESGKMFIGVVLAYLTAVLRSQ